MDWLPPPEISPPKFPTRAPTISPSHGPWSHQVTTSIGTCSITAITVYIFEYVPMEAGT
jgi:hypothetical protein